MELTTITVTLDNGLTYTHTGRPEVIKATVKKVLGRRKVPLSKFEAAGKGELPKVTLTPDQLKRAINAWKTAKARKPDYQHALLSVCEEVGCTRSQGRQVIKQVRDVVKRQGEKA